MRIVPARDVSVAVGLEAAPVVASEEGIEPLSHSVSLLRDKVGNNRINYRSDDRDKVSRCDWLGSIYLVEEGLRGLWVRRAGIYPGHS